MTDPTQIPLPPVPPPEETTAPSLGKKAREIVFGKPRNIEDTSLFHSITLIAFLAWVGLGADGLSSLSYGPQEAFHTLGRHTYLALALALVMAGTVTIISAAYSRIIEEFPHGGGGYLVATKLLGPTSGVVSGSALVVDYVLTVTVSIAAAGDAIFSFLPLELHGWKIPSEIFFIALLVAINIRGVRESVIALTPIFILFLVTHLILVVATLWTRAPEFGAMKAQVGRDFQAGLGALGWGGMLLLFAHAYSLGGGTYTGIEAVSNGVPLMREPKVQTAKKTMVYMAASLGFFAAGLLVCYLLVGARLEEGKTMNAVLFETVTQGWPGAQAWVIAALFSEAILLVVAAQAGFLAGPQVLANMAIDSWVPHWFSSLSERLTSHNGYVIVGAASLAALLYTQGNVQHLVVMYSINVFLTFSLSMLGMFLLWFGRRKTRKHWRRKASLFGLSLVLCAVILAITVFEKFTEGGWITLLATGGLVALCFLIRRHYRAVYSKLGVLDETLKGLELEEGAKEAIGEPDASKPTAAVLVGSYSGLGIHTVLNIFRAFPNHYKNLLFLSVGVIDSGELKGEEAIEQVKTRTRDVLGQYEKLAASLGFPSASRFSLGTDVAGEGVRLCREVAKEFPQTTFFAGQLIFQKESWYHRLLHNETAFLIQKKLQWEGKTMVILPVRVR